ncbi:MAG: GNAT family N-acetyltransferase [Mycobacterium sp.]|nr:GNAT family N-acetyltransferase [Mycobacterium sp.]
MTVALRRCRGPELDAATLYELLRLRVDVFVVEQSCPYPELDGRDLLPGTRHLWLQSAAGDVVSTLRLMAEPDDGFRIGRVCTRSDERGRGHTTVLMRAALDEVGSRPCRLDAQTYLARMYARHGFTPDGAEFVEDGIPHVPMLRTGSA